MGLSLYILSKLALLSGSYIADDGKYLYSFSFYFYNHIIKIKIIFFKNSLISIVLVILDLVVWLIFIGLYYGFPKSISCINDNKYIYPNQSLLNKYPDYSKVIELLKSGGFTIKKH